jgi:type IV pilus assembly protein PilE
MKHSKGFTLLELMIVVAIIGILAAIAYPSYTRYLTDARRADGQGALMSFANAMERYYTEKGSYADATPAGVYKTQVPDSGTAYYTLSIPALTSSSYTLRATPAGAQAGDGLLELDGTGARRWDRDNDGNPAEAGENCWAKSC